MDQARHVLMINLARHAEPARRQLAMTLEAVSQLTGVPLAKLVSVERGDAVDLSLDELTGLALFLGLTARGDPQPKPHGSK